MRILARFVSGLAVSALATAPLATCFAQENALPLGPDQKPLNLGFETGTLKDWTAAGKAFEGQPVRGDTVAARRSDMASGHRGGFWVGTYEVAQDAPQGTLTSVPFQVTHPYATFLVGGGSQADTRVEVCVADTREALFRATGSDSEDMRAAVVDLRDHRGKKIFLRLVDQSSGPWGHINFDDFRFHAAKPEVANPARAADRHREPPPTDTVQFAGLSAEEEAAATTGPEGFALRVFAAEPDVQQPIAMAIDDRGRVWIAEGYTYPVRAPEGQGKDRILILEDTDGDHRFDRRTIFLDQLNLVSGIEVGFGGVWIGAAPYLLFVPDRDGDDRPDGEPEILLDGWGYQDTHETLNTFTWGPDGWLYGCHGVFTHSRVGKPGTPDADRLHVTAAIWRYHPTRRAFEVFGEGTSNPWGVDFDEYGQCFSEACVIPHLFHVIQGARYERQGGSHVNPHVYDDIKTIADHVHWAGQSGPHAGNSRSDAAGGGHAHAGLMVYLGDSWPGEYRGKVFMNNIHGQRLNMDVLERKGSGFVGKHGPDLINFNDRWSQVLNLLPDHDGSVYLIDWYDKNQCHHGNAAGHDRSNGRVFKLVYRDQKRTPIDLRQKSDEEVLVSLQLHRNDWLVRHARRLLQERAARKELGPGTHEALRNILRSVAEPAGRLRALWALHVTGGADGETLVSWLDDRDEHIRAWTIQLLWEDRDAPPAALAKLADLAAKDPSPLVRLYVAAALQRTPLAARWPVLMGLHQRAEDAADHNLPLMAWYATEPMAALDPQRALGLALASRLPRTLLFTARRVAAIGTPGARATLARALSLPENESRAHEILRGIAAALRGQRGLPMPGGWPLVEERLGRSADPDVRVLTQSLSLIFGSADAMRMLRATLSDATAEGPARASALASLVEARDEELPVILQSLLRDGALRGQALRALAAYDHPGTAAAVLDVYDQLGAAEKRDALTTLVARLPYARALLAAVGKGAVPAKDLTADLVRQLRAHKSAELDLAVQEVWGAFRDSTEDKKKEIERYRKMYRAGGSQPGDASRGRAVFVKTCQQCHTLFDSGGKVGPDLTGSNRGDLEYILQNMVDPNAVIPNDYRAWTVITRDGRLLTGLVKDPQADPVTVTTQNEVVVLPRTDLQDLVQSEASMMPEDLLKPLGEQEVRDLIYYLNRPGQVPLIATKDTLDVFFDGKDLTGWEGSPEVWRVENGEVVGSTRTGLRRNEFLKSQMVFGDFRLIVQVKLDPDTENSGIQLRSEPIAGGEVKGYQADIGRGWWGKLYEEMGRGLLWDKSGEDHVKAGGWNVYEILAVGSRVRTAINGHPCVDLDDPQGATQGIIALQAHAGGPLEVRFKGFRLEVNPEPRLLTAQ